MEQGDDERLGQDNNASRPFLKYDLSKEERSLLSPEARKKYNNRRRSEQRNIKFALLSGPQQQQKLAIRARSQRNLRNRYKIAKVTTFQKKMSYVPIGECSPAQQEKQRAIWRASKASQRKKLYLTLSASADLAARDQVVVLQGKLANAQSRMDVITKLSPDDSTREMLLAKHTAIVAICTEDRDSMQHLVDCHLLGADHDVYGIHDWVEEDSSDNKEDVIGTNDDKRLAMDGKTELESSVDIGNCQDIGNSDENCSIVVATKNVVELLEHPLELESAHNGKCVESAIDIADDDLDMNSHFQNPCCICQFSDQQKRISTIMTKVLEHAAASFWKSSTRFTGSLNTTGHRIARFRASRLSTWLEDPKFADWCSKQLVRPDADKLHSLVTFKSVTDRNSKSITNDMTRRDFFRLLTLSEFLTDASLYMYSALLLERDHVMHLQLKEWRRSWIYGSHFYSKLSSNRSQYDYSGVKNVGTNCVPGNTRRVISF